MSVTVADCLKLASLKDAKVVAGEKGLDKIVTAVSVLEYADPTILSHDFFIGNEIILTAFVSAKNDVDTQCKIIKRLCEGGEVGIILYYVEVFMPSVDPKLSKLADSLNFPIIVMPPGRLDFRYSDVISEVLEAIFLDRGRDTYFVNSILERIAQINEHQRTINTVMRMLSDQLRCSLLLCDTSFKSLGFATWPMANWLSEDIVASLFCGVEVTAYNEITFDTLIDDTTVTVYRIPFKEIALRHLSLIAVDESSSINVKLLHQCIESIQLFASIWKYNLDYVQPDAMVPAILNDNPEKMRLIAKSFNINISVINTLLIFEVDTTNKTILDQHKFYDKLAIKARLFLKEHNKPIIADVYENRVIVLVEYTKTSDFDDNFMDDFFEDALLLNSSLLMTVCTNLISTKDARNAYLLYCESFETARRIYPRRQKFTTFELQFASECETILKYETSEMEKYTSPLAPLKVQNDYQDLIETLTVFLLDAANVTKETGEILYLHRNTVQYRINKVKQRLNYDVTKMPEAYTVYRAVALERLRLLEEKE